MYAIHKTSVLKTARIRLMAGLLSVIILSGCASGGIDRIFDPDQAATNQATGNWTRASVAAFSRGVNALGNDNELARLSFSEALESSPAMEPAYYNLAKLDLNQKNFDGVDSFVAIVESHQASSARLWNLFAASKRQQADFDAAKKYYLSAIQLDSSYTPALLNIAILYDVYLGEIVTAQQYYMQYQTQLELQGKEDNRLKNWLTEIRRRIAKQSGGGA